jgi:hypothetical protein
LSTGQARTSKLHPHPATVAQKKAAPHPATVAQRRAAPHPATVAQERAAPHPATVAQKRAAPPPATVPQPKPASGSERRPDGGPIQRSKSGSTSLTPEEAAQAIIDRVAGVLDALANLRRVLIMSDTLSSLESLTRRITTARTRTTTIYPRQFIPPKFNNAFPYTKWDWTAGLPRGIHSYGYDLIIARSMTCACDASDGHYNTKWENDVLKYRDGVEARQTCGGATPDNGLELLRIVYDLLSMGGEAYLTNSSLRSATGRQGRYYSYQMWLPIVGAFNDAFDGAASFIDTHPDDPLHAGFLGIRIRKPLVDPEYTRVMVRSKARLASEKEAKRKKDEQREKDKNKGTGSFEPTGVEAPEWGGPGPDAVDPHGWGQNHPLYLRFRRDPDVF